MKHAFTLFLLSLTLCSSSALRAQQHVSELIPADAMVSGVVYGSRYHLSRSQLESLEMMDLLQQEDMDTLVRMILEPEQWGIEPRSDWGFYLDSNMVFGIFWKLSDPERWFAAASHYAQLDPRMVEDFEFPTRPKQYEGLMSFVTGRMVACAPGYGGIIVGKLIPRDSLKKGIQPEFVYQKPRWSLDELEAFQVLDRDMQPHVTFVASQQQDILPTWEDLPEAEGEGKAEAALRAMAWFQKQLGTTLEGMKQVTGLRFDPGRIRMGLYYQFTPEPPAWMSSFTRAEADKRMWCHVPGRAQAFFMHGRMDFHRWGAALEQWAAQKMAARDPDNATLFALADLLINEEIFKDLWRGSFAISVEGSIPYLAEEETTTYDDNFNPQVTTRTVEKKLPRFVMAWDYGNEDTWLQLLRILDRKGRLQPHGKSWRLELASLPVPMYLYFRKGIAVCTNDERLAKRRRLPRRERLNPSLRSEVAANVMVYKLDLPHALELASEVLGSDLGMITALIPLTAIQGRMPVDHHPWYHFEQEMIFEGEDQDGLMQMLQFLDGMIGPMLSNLGGFEKS